MPPPSHHNRSTRSRTGSNAKLSNLNQANNTTIITVESGPSIANALGKRSMSGTEKRSATPSGIPPAKRSNLVNPNGLMGYPGTREYDIELPKRGIGLDGMVNKSRLTRRAILRAPLPSAPKVSFHNVTEKPDSRRSSHKVAEQRRRDSLKECFEDLRILLPHIPPSEDEEMIRRPGEGNVGGQRSNVYDASSPNKGVSKVALLRKSNDYLVKLHLRLDRRQLIIDLLREHVDTLRAKLPLTPIDELGTELDEIDWDNLDGSEYTWPWGGKPGMELIPPNRMDFEDEFNDQDIELGVEEDEDEEE